jgi:hypothetical protein
VPHVRFDTADAGNASLRCCCCYHSRRHTIPDNLGGRSGSQSSLAFVSDAIQAPCSALIQ